METHTRTHACWYDTHIHIFTSCTHGYTYSKVSLENECTLMLDLVTQCILSSHGVLWISTEAMSCMCGFWVCVCACMWAYPTMSQLCVNYTALTLSGRSPTTLSVVSMASFVVCTVRHHSGLCTDPRAHLNVKISYSPLGKTVKMVIVNTQKYTQYSHNSRTRRENKVQGRWHLLEFVLLLQIAALVHVHYTR